MDKLVISDVAGSLGPREPLHILDSTEEIGDALDSLDKQKLIVAPVRNPKNEMIALVSVFDLVNYAVLEKLPEADVGSLEPEAIPALKDTVQDVLDEKYRRFSLPAFKATDSILGPMKVFSEGKHKVLIEDEHNKPLYLFSQHDFIKFLNDNPSAVPDEITNQTASELGFSPTSNLVTSTTTTPVIDILRLLSKHDMTAVPLLDGKGHLGGTFSQSDLKGMSKVMLVDLFMEAIKFLEDEEARGAGRPINVNPDAKFGEIVIPLAFSGAHRVWITDDEGHCTGVASMTGIISSVTSAVWK